jgi:hypothetical protein
MSEVPAGTSANGKDEGATKPSVIENPKDKIGSRKIDVGLVPDSAIVGMAIALTEGAVKYGRFNWRIAGVSARIYHAACRRHLKKWWNGQDEDTATTVHHIDNAMACLAILRDAMLYDKLTDDRPPCPNENAMAEFVDAAEKKQAWLVKLFENANPKQYTIDDTRGT